MTGSIRNIVLGMPVRGDHILVSVMTDRRTGLEFGEMSEAALRREFKEELGFDITPVSLLGVLENHFELEGEPGHEIVHVYTVA